MLAFPACRKASSQPSRRRLDRALCLAALLLPGVAFGDAFPRLDQLEPLSIEEGLAHTSVWSIAQDATGFIWIGTEGPLSRFDGYTFQAFKHDPDDPDSIAISEVLTICPSGNGTLWLTTRGGGLNRYDPRQQRFSHYRHASDDPRSLADDTAYQCVEGPDGQVWVSTETALNRLEPDGGFTRFPFHASQPNSLDVGGITSLAADPDGTLWAGTFNSGLLRFEATGDAFTRYRPEAGNPNSLISDKVFSLLIDRAGHLWIASPGTLQRLDRSSGRVERFTISPSDPETADDPIISLLEDRHGRLWLGSLSTGLSIFDPTALRFSRYRYDPRMPNGLPSDEITDLFEDRSGIVWIGTNNGISLFDPHSEQFTPLRQRIGDDRGLVGGQVWTVIEDRSGMVWVGTFDGGLTGLDRAQGTVRHMNEAAAGALRLPSSSVTALLEDRDAQLWVGTRDGLVLLDAERRLTAHYRADPRDSHTLPQDFIRALLERRDGSLWVASNDTVSRFDRATQRFKSYSHDPSRQDALSSNDVYGLYEDRQETLWVITFGGLNRYEAATDGFSHIRRQPDELNSLSSDLTTTLYQDTSGIYWIGTSGGGLNRWDSEADTFRHYRGKDGLPDDTVCGILEDGQGRLWISTSNGLARFDTKSETFREYGTADGLNSAIFYIGPAYRSAEGEMFFGGPGGLTAFIPEHIQDHEEPPAVTITDFRLLNEPVPLRREDPDSPIADAITHTDEITLNHRHKILSFEFAALHYASPDRNRYAYRLEGFDTDWIETGSRQRFAQYTNLDAGDYVFRVKASNKDGVWNDDGVAVALTMLPPPWKTWWAYSLYTLALVSSLITYLRWHSAKLARERSINDRLREVDRLKDEFLANTSHELRTPLYGIVGIAESLIEGAAGPVSESLRANLAMIVGSGRRLSGLVSDILDFSRMSRKGLELQRKPIDLKSLVDVVLTLSGHLVGSKDLELMNGIGQDLPPADGDEDRLQQILLNLVGNAIKFTEAGEVEVSAVAEEGRLIVQVRDTGIGIAEDHQDHIFESFEQADASTEREFGGTGLGLAVTKELVSLHGGSLWVESKVGSGSTFFFTLPISEQPLGDRATNASVEPSRGLARVQGPIEPNAEILPAVRRSPNALADGVRRILIVDDEPVIRQVLLNYLAVKEYETLQASSGEQALELLGKESFDLVLLDVMMPKMSGFDVCRRLREHIPPQELPVIFLTAKDRVEDLVTAFSVGANDFLTKPVTKSELLTRVETHLELMFVHRSRERLLAERTTQLAERERLLGELEARNVELTRFNYTVSHDLKNPLVTIKNFAGLLRRDASSGQLARVERDVDRIESAADKMFRLIEELLELARSGHASGPAEEIPYRELVDETLAELADRIRERRVTVEIDDRLPTVLGDRTRLLEVVENLIDNAIKYLGDQPKPRIRIGVRDDAGQQVFIVSDNGMGIEPHYQHKVFGLFERLNPEDKEGTGLGLALVRQIIEAHGGKVWAESEGLGQGTTFCFTLSSSASA